MTLDHPVASSLLPVVLLIGIGFAAGRLKLIRGEAVRDLSNLVFLVLVQALLFRTMATADLARLDLRSVALYYIVAGAMFFALLLIRGLNSRSAVLALAAIFSNTLMIGVPLVQLAYGQAGLVHLFTLISMHALILLTLATVVLELLVAREQAAAGQGPRRHIAATVAQAVCQIRQSKLPDPKILANAGSFFKNPLLAAQAAQALLAQHPALPHYPQADGSVKLAAGWLIEQRGLKGFAVGDAAVHDKQALVLVNRGRARAADVAELVRIVCGRVQQRFGVALEMEPIWLPRPTAV